MIPAKQRSRISCFVLHWWNWLNLKLLPVPCSQHVERDVMGAAFTHERCTLAVCTLAAPTPLAQTKQLMLTPLPRPNRSCLHHCPKLHLHHCPKPNRLCLHHWPNPNRSCLHHCPDQTRHAYITAPNYTYTTAPNQIGHAYITAPTTQVMGTPLPQTIPTPLPQTK